MDDELRQSLIEARKSLEALLPFHQKYNKDMYYEALEQMKQLDKILSQPK